MECQGGGKEVHAADVARAANLLLDCDADTIKGQAYNAYDMYVSRYDVAYLAKKLSHSRAELRGSPAQPKHQIDTSKIRRLGMTFPGESRLRATVQELIDSVSP